MTKITVGSAALNQTPLDWEGNLNRIKQAVAQAKEKGVTFLCLPELALTGYGCEDMFFAPFVQEKALSLLSELTKVSKNIFFNLGLPLRYENVLYNVIAFIGNGKIHAFIPKQHLANEGVYYEPRWFRPWKEGKVGEVSALGQTFPIGDFKIDIEGVKLGFEICEDAWVSDRTGYRLMEGGIDLLFNPSASHFAFGKHETRKKIILDGSKNFQTTYVYSNLLGNEAGRLIFDGGCFIASQGKMLATSHRFSFEEVVLIWETIEIALEQKKKEEKPSSQKNPPTSFPISFSFPSTTNSSHSSSASWEKSDEITFEEFSRAGALALFDYMRKSHCKGFVVALSGGVDSTAVSLLAFLSFKLASLKTTQIKDLLTCLYLKTENNSLETYNAAEGVASALNASFLNFTVQPIVDTYTQLISQFFPFEDGKKLNWKDHDLSLQNIQARSRAPLAWFVANLKGALLLSTSNRSEAAVGYATMDGDTAGGLSPVAGVSKTFLRSWLVWMEKKGLEEIGPLNVLKTVNALSPTAELRPLGEKQTDETDLMLYPVLDEIEQSFAVGKLSPEEIFKHLSALHPELDTQTVKKYIQTFFTLWSKNQWKRERFAPSFHFDDHSLDPKTWFRFPILSANFQEELQALLAK